MRARYDDDPYDVWGQDRRDPTPEEEQHLVDMTPGVDESYRTSWGRTLRQELAELSGDPDALDRDSEVDIWTVGRELGAVPRRTGVEQAGGGTRETFGTPGERQHGDADPGPPAEHQEDAA